MERLVGIAVFFKLLIFVVQAYNILYFWQIQKKLYALEEHLSSESQAKEELEQKCKYVPGSAF